MKVKYGFELTKQVQMYNSMMSTMAAVFGDKKETAEPTQNFDQAQAQLSAIFRGK